MPESLWGRFSARAASPMIPVMHRGGVWIGIFIFIAGCATKPQPVAPSAAAPPPVAEDARLAIRNQGCSLLYHLLSDEKNLSKILLIKKEQSDLGELIKKISNFSGDTAKQFEAFAKADSHLHLNMDGLPQAEKETRDLISKTRAKELVTKSGEKFELRILLTQSEALTYGAHLAVVAQSHETDEARKKFLADTSQALQDLHQAVIDLMHTRWRTPTAR
jgi:hypothetical protein